MQKSSFGVVFLLSASCIWGTAFVAQSLGMHYMEPFTFNAARFSIGGFAVLLALLFAGNARCGEEKRREGALLAGGLSCGTVLFVAASLQQIGVLHTTAGKAGFITTLYIVVVPLLGLLTGKKIAPMLWLSVLLAVVGAYLLCVKDSLAVGKGDLYVLACAFFFAFHILFIDRYVPLTDGLKLSCAQFFVCGALSGVCAVIFEHPEWAAVCKGWGPVLYTGVLSCGVAYTFQTLGQRTVSPTVAALVLSLESVFAALAGWWILDEALSGREVFGCAVLFAAVLMAQLPDLVRRPPASIAQ